MTKIIEKLKLNIDTTMNKTAIINKLLQTDAEPYINSLIKKSLKLNPKLLAKQISKDVKLNVFPTSDSEEDDDENVMMSQ